MNEVLGIAKSVSGLGIGIEGPIRLFDPDTDTDGFSAQSNIASLCKKLPYLKGIVPNPQHLTPSKLIRLGWIMDKNLSPLVLCQSSRNQLGAKIFQEVIQSWSATIGTPV